HLLRRYLPDIFDDPRAGGAQAQNEGLAGGGPRVQAGRLVIAAWGRSAPVFFAADADLHVVSRNAQADDRAAVVCIRINVASDIEGQVVPQGCDADSARSLFTLGPCRRFAVQGEPNVRTVDPGAEGLVDSVGGEHPVPDDFVTGALHPHADRRLRNVIYVLVSAEHFGPFICEDCMAGACHLYTGRFVFAYAPIRRRQPRRETGAADPQGGGLIAGPGIYPGDFTKVAGVGKGLAWCIRFDVQRHHAVVGFEPDADFREVNFLYIFEVIRTDEERLLDD